MRYPNASLYLLECERRCKTLNTKNQFLGNAGLQNFDLCAHTIYIFINSMSISNHYFQAAAALIANVDALVVQVLASIPACLTFAARISSPWA
jgi:hypothetical protein